MTTEELIAAALDWAKQGVPVFPCSADNKAPLTANGFYDASTDPAKIRAMFKFAPTGSLIGGRMGKDAGLFAVDFDLYKQGAEDYMRELSDRGLLSETQVHTTRSGGLHFVYQSSDGFPNCVPHSGVEVKGEGGYIIMPPSPGYEIQVKGINYANPELIKEFMAARAKASSSTIDSLKRQILSGKSFHEPLAQIAARRSAQGWPVERIQKELLDILAASAASAEGHSRHSRWKHLLEDAGEELSRIVASGSAKYSSTSKTDKVKDTVSHSMADNYAKQSESFFGRRDEFSSRQREDEPLAIEDNSIEKWPFDGAGYFSGEDRDILSQRYIMYPLLAERETVLIAAEPKTGKTAIALKLAIQIAAGEKLGPLDVAEPRPVLYFSLEGARAVELRLKADKLYREEHELETPKTDMLYVVDTPHNFLQADQQTQNCAKIALHNEKCKQEFGVELGVVVLDTLTKAMPAGDQNSVEDTSKLFELIGKLRQFGVNATIIFIHHMSKQGQVRGSTNIEAEVDVVLGVEKIKGSTDVVMRIRRARSMDEDANYRFGFKSMELGKTVQGHRLSAPYVHIYDAGSSVEVGKTMGEAVQWQRINEILIEKLGSGNHDVSELVAALYEYIPQPGGRRPNFHLDSVQKPLKTLFEGRHSWAFGDWHLSMIRAPAGDIDAIELRLTARSPDSA